MCFIRIINNISLLHLDYPVIYISILPSHQVHIFRIFPYYCCLLSVRVMTAVIISAAKLQIKFLNLVKSGFSLKIAFTFQSCRLF